MQKNQKNKERGVLYSAFVLLLVTGIIAFLVAFVNSVTSPVIETNDKQKVKEKINELFKDNSGYEDMTAECEKDGFLKGADGVVSVYKVCSGAGGGDSYCIRSKAAGYGGDVELLVGFDCDGAVSGVKLLSASGETPGLGQRVAEESFLSRFGGLDFRNGGTVQGITGATVSSKAAVKAVNAACVAVSNILHIQIGEDSSAQSGGGQSSGEVSQ